MTAPTRGSARALTAHQQGVWTTVATTFLALLGTVFGVRLDPAQAHALQVAAGLVVATILALYHVAATRAEAEGLPDVDFHGQAFWVGVVGSALAVAVAFGAHLTPSQQQLLLSAAAAIAAFVLGSLHVAARGELAEPPATPPSPPTGGGT